MTDFQERVGSVLGEAKQVVQEAEGLRSAISHLAIDRGFGPVDRTIGFHTTLNRYHQWWPLVLQLKANMKEAKEAQKALSEFTLTPTLTTGHELNILLDKITVRTLLVKQGINDILAERGMTLLEVEKETIGVPDPHGILGLSEAEWSE